MHVIMRRARALRPVARCGEGAATKQQLRAFAFAPAPLRPALDLDELARRVLEEGHAVVPPSQLHGAARLVAAAAAEIAPVLGAPAAAEAGGTRRLGALFNHSAAAQELALHPAALGACDRLLLPSCVRYQLNFTGAIALDTGCAPQGVHRDVGLYPLRHSQSTPLTQVQAVWALTDFCAGSGGLLTAPGSHRWPDDRVALPGELAPVVMEAGSLLLYSSALLHGTGTNTNPHPTVSVAFQQVPK